MILASGIILRSPSGSVLLLRRSADGDAEGLWAFPGGKLEDGEDASAAAARETLEETGFLADPPGKVLMRRVKDGVDYTTFLTDVDEEFVPVLNGEHTAFAWVKPGDVFSDNSARADSEWSEADHPRGQPENAGQFGPGGGGASTAKKGHVSTKVVNGKRVSGDGEDLPEHIQALKLPPAWANVTYNPDPKAALQAVGTDSKGRQQSVYSKEHTANQAQIKFSRIHELDKKFDNIFQQNEGACKSDNIKKRAVGECALLIMSTGIRPGSEEDTGAEKKAYGATTLEGRHVVVSGGGKVNLKFVGKKGVDLDIPVADERVAQMLIKRKEASGDSGKLFDCSETELLDHVHSFDGGGFKTKDFRTLVGTRTAMLEVSRRKKPPADEKEYKKAVHEVAVAVSKKLGNTPIIALNSYISPFVFSEWRMQS